MSIINEALKKAQKETSSQPVARNLDMDYESKRGINWGPIFVLLVLVLIAAPILAPVFALPFKRLPITNADSSRQISAGASLRPAPAAQPVSATRQGQFGIEEIPNPMSQAAVLYPRPDLRLSGLVYSKTSDSYCIINDRVVKLGESVDGARLVSVDPKQVVLEYQGEKVTIPVTEE
jgi:hypothetical protein